MPLDRVVDYYQMPSDKNMSVIGKKVIYSAAIGSVGAWLLGGESFSENLEFVGLNLPAPISAGLGIAAGSLTANLLDSYLLNMLFDNQSGVRQLESAVVRGGLAAGGSVAGMYYGSGIPPSLNGAVLGVASYMGSEYLYNDLDSMLLGKLY